MHVREEQKWGCHTKEDKPEADGHPITGRNLETSLPLKSMRLKFLAVYIETFFRKLKWDLAGK